MCVSASGAPAATSATGPTSGTPSRFTTRGGHEPAAGRRGGGQRLPQRPAVPPQRPRAHRPPLRDRGPDIGRLTVHYWQHIVTAAGSRATLARDAVAALGAHPWPGNVRELQNVLANLTVTGPRYGPVGPDGLPAAFRRRVAAERRRRSPRRART